MKPFHLVLQSQKKFFFLIFFLKILFIFLKEKKTNLFFSFIVSRHISRHIPVNYFAFSVKKGELTKFKHFLTEMVFTSCGTFLGVSFQKVFFLFFIFDWFSKRYFEVLLVISSKKIHKRKFHLVQTPFFKLLFYINSFGILGRSNVSSQNDQI